jgi:uncharacterized protein YodC (DUF2158 family)
MAKKWKPGDKVKLASGGPTMIVALEQYKDKRKGEVVGCIWFDKVDHVQEGLFAPALLESADQPESG